MNSIPVVDLTRLWKRPPTQAEWRADHRRKTGELPTEPFRPMPDIDWQKDSLCRKFPDLFYPPDEEGAWANKDWSYEPARAICYQCPVKPECRELADRYEEGNGRGASYGMWAGESPRERWARRRAEALQHGS